ncbi:MAG: hypothetical protein WC877_01955 [Dehalococcoidales bacterium]|jgi:hypothetical protein
MTSEEVKQIIDSWKDDPEVIAAVKFMDEVSEPTLENVLKILIKLGSYAFKENKTSGDYQDMFALIGITTCKIEQILDNKKKIKEE